jgi:hypothetical protein
VVINLCLAEETAFSGVKLADTKGKQVDARLISSDINQNLVVRVADHDFVTVPYNRLDTFSYEYTKKHRVTQGRHRDGRLAGSWRDRHADKIQEPLALH